MNEALTEPDSTIPSRLYANPQARASWARAFLILAMVASVAACISYFMEWRLLGEFQRGNFSVAKADANDLRQKVISWIGVGIQILTVIALAGWLRRITLNLRPMVVGPLRYGPRWAALGWFVPILGFWRPKQVINQAWRVTTPGVPPPSKRREKANVPGIYAAWWALFLVAGFALRAASRSTGTSIENLKSNDVGSIVAEVLWLGAAVLAITVVSKLTARQVDRAEELGIREWDAMDDMRSAEHDEAPAGW
ncbi:MAG: DUF4328 domain-containing protein [Thermoleophilia bacterium]|nr:DUF4328 domain-containing protein [Thermoleophilia bacterium]